MVFNLMGTNTAFKKSEKILFIPFLRKEGFAIG